MTKSLASSPSALAHAGRRRAVSGALVLAAALAVGLIPPLLVEGQDRADVGWLLLTPFVILGLTGAALLGHGLGMHVEAGRRLNELQAIEAGRLAGRAGLARIVAVTARRRRRTAQEYDLDLVVIDTGAPPYRLRDRVVAPQTMGPLTRGQVVEVVRLYEQEPWVAVVAPSGDTGGRIPLDAPEFGR